MMTVINSDAGSRHAADFKKVILVREHNAEVISRYISIYGKYMTADKLDRITRHLANVRSSVLDMKQEYTRMSHAL